MDSPGLAQRLLLSPEELNTYSLLKKYDRLFLMVNSSSLGESCPWGRPLPPRSALLRALISKNIRCLPSVTELAIEFKSHCIYLQVTIFAKSKLNGK